MIRPTDRDSINIAKFLSNCRDMGIPRGELFSPSDLTEATAESSLRVASAILTLAKLSTTDDTMTAESMAKFSKSTAAILQKEKDKLSSIEASVDQFITSQMRKDSLRYDQDGQVSQYEL